MTKLLIIAGPTASGKTPLGIKLARRFNGEVVSADSRQVYRGMDLGTAKDLLKNSKFQISNFKFQPNGYQIGYYLFDKVPVWLLDVVKPDCRFTAADYVSCASLVINQLWGGKKLPILVGGTGFYIKALVEGLETLGIPPNWALRKTLENQNLEGLQEKLKKIDLKRWKEMNQSDRKNPHRLIRAIEIAQNQPNRIINHQPLAISHPRQIRQGRIWRKPLTINHLFIGLTASSKILYPQIDRRVEERIRRGIVTEIESLLKKGYSWRNSVLGETIGYQEFQPFFAGQETLSEAVQKWKYAEHAYARRQKTWFKKAFPSQEVWFDITQKGFVQKIEKKVRNWLKA